MGARERRSGPLAFPGASRETKRIYIAASLPVIKGDVRIVGVGKHGRRAALIGAATGAVAFLSLAEWYLRAHYRERVTSGRPSPLGGITVVALGDSIVAGIEAGPSPAWPELLGRHLQSIHSQARWCVRNAGVPGDTAPLGLGRFDRDVAPFHPQLVLIAFGLNDCHLYRHALDYWFEEHLPLIATRSFLWRLLRSRCENLLRRGGLIPAPVPEKQPVRYPRTTLQGFERALSELICRTRMIGARPVLVAMTPLATCTTEAVTERLFTYPRYTERITEIAGRTAIPVVRPANPPRGIWLDDGLHLTSEGQAWLASEVFAELERQGVWRELLQSANDGR